MTFFTYLKKVYKRYTSKRQAATTVRYMFPALLGTILLLSATAVSSLDQSYVYLTTTTRTVEVGELVTVEVGVSAHTPINAVDILLQFPKNSLDVFSVDRGQSVLTIWTEDPIIHSDSVQLVGGTFKRGFIGQHEIATVKFRALEKGQYEISANKITFVAGDGSGSKVPVTNHQSSVLTLFNYDENTSADEIKIAVSSGIATDLNNDGRVSLQDISAFMGAWSNKSQIFDFNNDGRMTFKDFSIILADYFGQ